MTEEAIDPRSLSKRVKDRFDPSAKNRRPVALVPHVGGSIEGLEHLNLPQFNEEPINLLFNLKPDRFDYVLGEKGIDRSLVSDALRARAKTIRVNQEKKGENIVPADVEMDAELFENAADIVDGKKVRSVHPNNSVRIAVGKLINEADGYVRERTAERTKIVENGRNEEGTFRIKYGKHKGQEKKEDRQGVDWVNRGESGRIDDVVKFISEATGIDIQRQE